MTDDLLTAAQAAELLQVKQRQVRNLIRKGTLPATRFGWAYAIRRADVLALPPRRPGRPRRQLNDET